MLTRLAFTFVLGSGSVTHVENGQWEALLFSTRDALLIANVLETRVPMWVPTPTPPSNQLQSLRLQPQIQDPPGFEAMHDGNEPIPFHEEPHRFSENDGAVAFLLASFLCDR